MIFLPTWCPGDPCDPCVTPPPPPPPTGGLVFYGIPPLSDYAVEITQYQYDTTNPSSTERLGYKYWWYDFGTVSIGGGFGTPLTSGPWSPEIFTCIVKAMDGSNRIWSLPTLDAAVDPTITAATANALAEGIVYYVP